MTLRKIVNGELRAYININGIWRHVYILSSYDQFTVSGSIVRVLNFKLSKRSKDIFSAEKIKFYKTKPSIHKIKNDGAR